MSAERQVDQSPESRGIFDALTPRSEMLVLWTIWGLMVALAVAMSGCKEPGFKGKGNSGGLPGQFAQGNNGGGGNSAGGNTAGGPNMAQGNTGGIDTAAGSSDVVMVPMKVKYEAKESISGGYKGAFDITFKYETGQEKHAFSFNAGASTTEIVVPAACSCGRVNNIDLLIQADNQRRNLQGWHQEVITSHNPPASGSDWDSWLDKLKVKPAGPSTVYLGGFDHIFLFGQSCGSFACDERKWNNRDDTKMLFICQLDQCPQKELNFELKFIGMDP